MSDDDDEDNLQPSVVSGFTVGGEDYRVDLAWTNVEKNSADFVALKETALVSMGDRGLAAKDTNFIYVEPVVEFIYRSLFEDGKSMIILPDMVVTVTSPNGEERLFFAHGKVMESSAILGNPTSVGNLKIKRRSKELRRTDEAEEDNAGLKPLPLENTDVVFKQIYDRDQELWKSGSSKMSLKQRFRAFTQETLSYNWEHVGIHAFDHIHSKAKSTPPDSPGTPNAKNRHASSSRRHKTRARSRSHRRRPRSKSRRRRSRSSPPDIPATPSSKFLENLLMKREETSQIQAQRDMTLASAFRAQQSPAPFLQQQVPGLYHPAPPSPAPFQGYHQPMPPTPIFQAPGTYHNNQGTPFTNAGPYHHQSQTPVGHAFHQFAAANVPGDVSGGNAYAVPAPVPQGGEFNFLPHTVPCISVFPGCSRIFLFSSKLQQEKVLRVDTLQRQRSLVVTTTLSSSSRLPACHRPMDIKIKCLLLGRLSNRPSSVTLKEVFLGL
jgi:hypothetical protein